jgi:cytochrome P450
VGFFMRALEQHGDIVRLRFGPKSNHLLRHPDHIKVVLQDRYQDFGKESRGFKKIKLLLGEGLLTSDGAFWQRQRRIAQPSFHHRRISQLTTTMVTAAEEMPVDMSEEMMRITLTIVVRALLGSDLPPGAFQKVKWGLGVCIDFISHNIYRVVDVPTFLPTARNREFRAAVEALDEIVVGIIEERRRTGAEHGDLLQMLMDARDEETGEGMTDLHLRDEVMTIFLAGHETTAIALTWAWYLLCRHSEMGERVRAELDSVLGGRTPTMEDLPKLVDTNKAILETLRLYPPLWAFSRVVKKDVEVGGYTFPQGSMVFISPFATHRHPEFWDNPEGVSMDRFPGGKEPTDLPKFAYMPFGGGPRNCIGSTFALFELQVIIATLAQRFRPEILGGWVPEMAPILTLRPKGGLPMLIKPAG